MLNSEFYNLPRWNGRDRPFYETYYLKMNDPTLGVALWLRYAFLSPANSESTASVWAIFSDSKDPSKNFALKETIPARQAIFKKGRFYLNIGGALLDNTSASGRVSGGGSSVEWDLSWHATDDCYLPLPWLFYFLPYPPTRSAQPTLSSNLRGHFAVNGVKYPCSHLKIHQGHVWGKRYSRGWTWANCMLFNEDPNTVLELVASGGLGIGAMIMNNKEATLLLSGRALPSGWEFSGIGLKRRVEGRIVVNKSDMIGLTYEDPSGGQRFCYNTKLADIVMDVYKRKGLHWVLVSQLTSFGGAAFEYVTDKPLEGYRIFL